MWLVDDVRWAWRGIVGRRWRAGLIVGLIAVAIAANAMIFTVADALVLNPLPYRDSDRIVMLNEVIPDAAPRGQQLYKARLAEWQKQSDVFTAVGSYLTKNGVFIVNGGSVDQVATVDVTVHLLDVLGVKPQWGRGFVEGDDTDPGTFAVLISPNLARKYFGSPGAAVGQVLQATAAPHRVIGVMPEDFAFPRASFEMWRALDPTGPLTRNFGFTKPLARVTPAVAPDQVDRVLGQRAAAVGSALGLSSYAVTTSPGLQSRTSGELRTLLFVLLGAALCLLLAACANVASLELAASIVRTRTYAVQLALGASRLALARVAALEGAMLIGTSLIAGLAIVYLGSTALFTILPDSLRLSTQNRLGLDVRAIGYTSAVAALAWILSALAPVVAASRSNLLSVLRLEDRGSAVSRAGVRVRHLLTTIEVALAVMLVIGGLLYTRTYQSLLAVEKGFASSGLINIGWTVPNGHFASAADRAQAVDRIMSTLASRPGVLGITQSSPPPSTGDSPSPIALEVDDRPPLANPVLLGANWVDSTYFSVVRLPLRSGRLFAAGDPPTAVVVSETFAKRFWPGGDAIGHTFRLRPQQPWNQIIGVVGDFRTARTTMPAVSDRVAFYYVQRPATTPQAAGAAAPAGPRPIDTGGSYGFISLTLRLDSTARAHEILAVSRTLEPGLRVTLESIDELYARQNADTRLASQIVGGFSVIAFIVAIAGVYGLMAYLVSSRTREIGVRIALGASSRDIRRLVFGSSARLIAIGAAMGIVGAVLVSRWIASAMFGISATDPLTYALVTAIVAATALMATWQPARQAAKVDPAKMLRAD